ncbi:MAG: GNAT family N-acetyltransferase [Sphingopyxis sp.]
MTGVRLHRAHIAALGYDALSDVERLMQRAFDPRYGEAWSKAQCLSLMALPGYRICGLMSPEGAMLGFSISRSVAGECELLLIAIDPSVRRSGYGSLLIDHWIDDCRASGAGRLFLEVRADNPALGLYQRVGFSQAAIRPSYYRGQDGVMRDAITMQLILE